jgi:Na+/melibiose symporter-like transporter
MIISAIAAHYIYKADTEKRSDYFFASCLVVITVLFIYPFPLPQYTLLLLAFLIFAVIHDRRYLIPWTMISVAAGIYAMTAGPIDLLSVASFTDILNIDSVMQMISQYQTYIFGDTRMGWIYFICKYAQLIGILSILWLMFGKIVKRHVRLLIKRPQGG